jgi:hypothetical protein
MNPKLASEDGRAAWSKVGVGVVIGKGGKVESTCSNFQR